MNTDRPPRKPSFKEEYSRSDELRTISLPPEDPLRTCAAQLEQALANEDKRAVQLLSNEISALVCKSFGVPAAPVRILGARPREVDEDTIHETFGDYTFKTAQIRLWMRTAVHQKPTAYGTFLSTLCHELCHHLDVVLMDLPHTYHTRGFYERAGLLYHHVRGTPLRPLVWKKQSDGTYAINWPATMRGAAVVTSAP